MDGRKLQDRLYLGFGLSARHIGQSTDAFRPKGPFDPLNKEIGFCVCRPHFVSGRGNADRTNVYGDPLWHGVFDASYTQPGDFLVNGDRKFFVASQMPLLPILCVLANRIISIARPNVQAITATNPYGGYFSGSSLILLSGWPASVLSGNHSASLEVNLPTDQAASFWEVLVPSTHGVALSCGDLITDDLGRTAVIAVSELTDLGWRISAKVATT